MAVEHMEIERKFDVEESFVLPDLHGLPGVAEVSPPVEHVLEAAYYDTADLRLARARVTLRRRTGGNDAGWHVKLPAAAGARRELHSPVGRAARTPPKTVLEPVLGIVRSAPAEQVAALRTRRQVTELRNAEGGVLAEIADDHVTGTALAPQPGGAAVVTAWREVEVELVDGDEALLAAVAEAVEAAGARPASAPSKLARVLGDRLAELDGAAAPAAAPEPAPTTGQKGKKGKKKPVDVGDPGRTAGEVVRAVLRDQVVALQNADLMVRTGQPDGVHQVRVACRRLRSVLAAFRPALDRARTDPLREELAEVGAALSGGRDAEVALGHLRALVAEQPDELVLGPVAARLQQSEFKELQEAERTARKALSGAAYFQLRDDLDALVADPPFTEHASAPAEEVAREVLARTSKRLRRTVHDAMDTDDPAALHEVRKAAKRVRYSAEAVVQVLGEPAAELVEVLKDVQDVLGARQDTVVTRELCTRLGLQAFGAGENAWTYGRLHGLEEARADQAERDFWARWPVLKPVLKAVPRT